MRRSLTQGANRDRRLVKPNRMLRPRLRLSSRALGPGCGTIESRDKRPLILNSRRLGPPGPGAMVCIHGVTHHGGVFELFAKYLQTEHQVLSLDLRGHGASGREPPWDTETQASDVLETLDSLGIKRVTLVGHSFGARVAASVADRSTQQIEDLILLDPALEIPGAYALASAEIDRLDWTFASVESAVTALMSAKGAVDLPRDVVTAFAEGDLAPGLDGRLRFSYSPSAAVVSWSEMARPAPPIADARTLIVRPIASHIDGKPLDRRYRTGLGSQLTIATVPRGHNLLWEAPLESATVVSEFLRSPQEYG